jgi:nitrogen PTS system EIIA component
MNLASLLAPNAVFLLSGIESKRRLFQELAKHAAKLTGIPEMTICSKLMERERLGATAMRGGLAIPHARLKESKKIFCCFIRLSKALDFDVPGQEKPVDLIFLMLVPEDENRLHLQALSLVASRFSEDGVRAAIREADTTKKVHTIITQGLG